VPIEENNLSAPEAGFLKSFYRSWRTYLLLFMGLSVCVAALPSLVNNWLSISLVKAISIVGFDQMLDETGLSRSEDALGVRNTVVDHRVDARLAHSVSQLYPTNRQLQRNLGRVAMWNGDFKQASTIFQQMRILDPSDPLAAWYLATIYDRARSPGSSPADAYRIVEFAHALEMTGRTAEAVQLLDAHGVGGALANAIRGNYYQGTGQLDVAVLFLESSVQQSPQDPWFRQALAITYARQGQRESAIAQLQAALEFNPQFQPALDLLGCLSVAGDLKQCVTP